MTTDFTTIYNQTSHKVEQLKKEISALNTQIQKAHSDFEATISDTKKQGQTEAQRAELDTVEYKSKIQMDKSTINIDSVYNLMKNLLKI